jgi:hypothetical protein
MHPHEILGVSEFATADEIKRAWRKKALACHPDRGGNPEHFKAALRAYEILKDARPNPQRATAPDRDKQPSETESKAPSFEDAYYDAWNDVPSDIRFRFTTFETLHGLTMLVAGPFFFGGLLLFFGGLNLGKGQQVAIGFLLTVVCGSVWYLALSGFWDEQRFALKDRYARKTAKEQMALARPS